MEFLRRYWTQVAAQLGEMTPTQKWLILSLTVILLLSGFVMLQYAAAPEMVPITRFSSDPATVVSHLGGRGIQVKSEGGKVLVPREQLDDALFVMEEGKLLRADTSAAYEEAFQSSPFESRERHRARLLHAKQAALAGIIRRMQNVEAADVLIDLPSSEGFGKTHVSPTASVSVVLRRDVAMSKTMVRAVAGLVSGAVAAMRPQEVTVVDANRGASHAIPGDDMVPPSDSMALMRQIEEAIRKKIVDLLQIPGLVVAVNVETDNTIHEHIEETEYQKEDQVASEKTIETTRREASDMGEPGGRSNTGASIANGRGDTFAENSEEMETKFADKQVTSRRSRVEVGHQITSTNVSINVPQAYIKALFVQKDPDRENADEVPLDPAFVDEILKNIEELVEPQVKVTEGSWEVKASMMAGALALAPLGDAAYAPSGLMQLVGSSWLKTAGLSALAVLSLALMFGMVRRATVSPDLPSVEELAGLSPPLDEEDLVGEAMESRAEIEGLEMGDGEMRSRKIAEQISDMIKSNPDEASSLLGRWVRRGD